jgi:alpha-mannosidase
VHGATNVFLETIKRGENDKFDHKTSTSTVVLRLYEAFGGHARASLKIASHLRVSKAYLTNFLEDEVDELSVKREEREEGATIMKLDFHGFEVKTVKLVLGDSRIEA